MIKFPKLSVATSTVNRILNVSQEIKRRNPEPKAVATIPNAPESIPIGDSLDKTLTQPPQTSDAPPDQADAIALSIGGLV